MIKIMEAGGVTGTQRLEVKDTAQCPMRHRTAHLPSKKESSTQMKNVGTKVLMFNLKKKFDSGSY